MAQATCMPGPAVYNGLSPVAKATLATSKLRKAASPAPLPCPHGHGIALASLPSM